MTQKPLTKSTLRRLYRARENGMTWRRIGDEFGLSSSSARRAYFRIIVETVKESSYLEEARERLKK